MHDTQTQDILRPFVNLRHRLLPYNYSLANQNSLSGIPLMRPHFFSDESNPALIDNAQTYFWGDAFLVTPVTEPGVSSVQVTLPKGVWFDYWTDRRHVGGQAIAAPVTLKTLPVFVKAGAFIPMASDMANTEAYDSSRLQVHYYADASVKSAKGVMFDDDGKDPEALAKGRFERIDFSASQNQRSLQLSLQRSGDFPGRPDKRHITLVVHNIDAVQSVQVNGMPTDSQYDAAARKLSVPLEWQNTPLKISIK